MFRQLLAVALLFGLAACQLPKDPENTTQTVQGAVLKVGLLQDPLPQIDLTAVTLIADALNAPTTRGRRTPSATSLSVPIGQNGCCCCAAGKTSFSCGQIWRCVL